MIALYQVELIVPAVGEPAIDQVIIEPRAPAALNGHAKVHLRDAEEDAEGEDREIEQGQPEDGGTVATLQGIEDGAIPGIHRVCRADNEENNEQQGRGQHPRAVGPFAGPKSCCRAPEPAQQVQPEGRVVRRVRIRIACVHG
jgi:hypothetical protein